MTAAAKTNVSAYASSSTLSGWYISSGDKFYVLGRNGSNSQVAYPISGGYKVAWIKNYNVAFNNKYTVTLNSANSTMGTVSGGGTYSYLDQITILAKPNSGYKFTKWNDGNTSASRAISVTNNVTYTASFEADPNTCSHTFGGWITDKEASCTAQGLRHRVCSKCGYAENDILAMLSHKYDDNWIIETPATCESDGEKYRKCVY